MEGRLLLLVVDDESDLLTVYEMLFALEGFDVATAANGHEALDRVAERRPALVVTDQMMPLMNGLELARRLRGDEATRRIPIILSSAVQPQEGGFQPYDLFVPKPVRFEDLVAGVRELLRRAPPPAPSSGRPPMR